MSIQRYIELTACNTGFSVEFVKAEFEREMETLEIKKRALNRVAQRLLLRARRKN